MPVDLKALPEKRALPQPPHAWRWCLIVLLCSLLVGALVVLLWPGDSWRLSPWFWCCALVLPLMSGLALYALRRLIYERRCEYLDSWNQTHAEQEQVLIKKGQRAIALLATSYCCGAGYNLIAQALLRGSKPLHPVYIKSKAQTLRLSQLEPSASLYTEDEYTQRLTTSLQQVMRGLEPEMERYRRNRPLCVRIRHNQVLGDEQVLSLWRSCRGSEQSADQVVFATQDDGLLWLDTWLDEHEPDQLLLSLEFNLFLDPVAEHAESISAVLLAQPDRRAKQRLTPIAWVHRPVPMTEPAGGVLDALFWGQVAAENNEFFTWQTQLPSELRADVTVAMKAAGRSLDSARCHSLDGSLGLPGCAVGNMALIIASENAAIEGQAQLLMLQDASPQACVIQPVCNAEGRD
ncbi:MAG TPA: hypothetical protein VGC62_20650 [Pseudomonas sp.]|uniref:hypothetical protein n=1 Tax=Pseudomonas sp. TaxID=306 RepID=UPI002ED9368B